MSNASNPVTSNPATTNQAASTSTAPDGGKTYYNLLTTGIAYLNRVRTVPSEGQSYLAVSLSALRGPSNRVKYTWFDCIVSGAEAKKVVGEQLREAIEAKRKVLVGFVIGDQQLKEFVYKKGDKQGKTGTSTKAHLLLIKWAKVDGQKVYEMPPSPRSIEDENEAIYQQYIEQHAEEEALAA